MKIIYDKGFLNIKKIWTFIIIIFVSNESLFNFRHFEAQRQDANVKWNMKEDFEIVYSDIQGEIVVGGVFLRIFIANPAWVLRKPKEFLTELLEKWAQSVESSSPDVRFESIYLIISV